MSYGICTHRLNKRHKGGYFDRYIEGDNYTSYKSAKIANWKNINFSVSQIAYLLNW